MTESDRISRMVAKSDRGILSYYQEDYDHEDVVREHYINLVPSGFQPYRIGGGNTITSDADQFWAEPVIDRL